MSNEVDFLRADKHESLVQIDRMILMGMVKHSQSSQNCKSAMSLQYLKKEVRDEADLLHVDKHQSFIQVDSNTLGIKVSFIVILSFLMDMIKHFKVVKATSLQYLYNISKKKLVMEFLFLHAYKHQSFYKLALSFLMEVARHVQSMQNMKLVIFVRHIKKKLFYSDVKH